MPSRVPSIQFICTYYYHIINIGSRIIVVKFMEFRAKQT